MHYARLTLMKTRIKHFIGFFSLFFVTIVWGATFTLTKNALSVVPAFPFLAVRFTLATAIFLPILFGVREFRRLVTLRVLRTGSLLGLILFGVFASQTIGLESTTPAQAGFLTGLSVLFVPLFSLFLGKKISIRSWIAVGCAVLGLFLLFNLKLHGFTVGDTLVLLCAVFAAMQILLTEKFAGNLPALGLAMTEIVTVAVLAWLTIFFQMWFHAENVHSSPKWMNVHVWLNPAVVTAILINGVLGTSLAYFIQTYFQTIISATETAVIFSFEPVFSALIAWIVLQSRLDLTQVIGCLVLLGSMLLSDVGIQRAIRNLRIWKFFGPIRRD